jgi:hypothetical protein
MPKSEIIAMFLCVAPRIERVALKVDNVWLKLRDTGAMFGTFLCNFT